LKICGSQLKNASSFTLYTTLRSEDWLRLINSKNSRSDVFPSTPLSLFMPDYLYPWNESNDMENEISWCPEIIIFDTNTPVFAVTCLEKVHGHISRRFLYMLF
jgi:hypothetical protein